MSRPGDWLQPRTVKRPALFFNQDDPALAEVEYQFTVPPMLRDVGSEPLVQDMQAQIRDAQEGHRASIFAEGRSFLGVKGVLGADPFSSPKTRRPRGTTNPTCAAGGDRELLLAAKRMVRSFRERYREAWLRYKQGLYAVFPAGTLAMRIRHRVPCDDADPPPWCYAAPCAA